MLDHDRANLLTLKLRAPDSARRNRARLGPDAPSVAQTPTLVLKKPLAALADILSTWFIAPLVFLFLLRDTGEIKRGLLRAVPNRLFEPALTVMADLDRALGDYMRGIFLECALAGPHRGVVLAIVGVPLRWAIAIGHLSAGAPTWFRTSAP